MIKQWHSLDGMSSNSFLIGTSSIFHFYQLVILGLAFSIIQGVEECFTN